LRIWKDVSLRLASLFTGGKDSTYATHLALEGGDEVAVLVTMMPRREDSWMFHSANIHMAGMVAEAMGLKHMPVPTRGEKDEELKDLRRALLHLDVEGIVSGAIASRYQRDRIDHVCRELGLIHITPLWGRDRVELMEEMLSEDMSIMVSAVAALGLDENWLGRIIDFSALEELKELYSRFGVDPCGEGGEMETLVLDAPWFKSRIEIVRARREWKGLSGSLILEDVRLVGKD
jgi:ABC transporter with metal-binding/Fe-S-binding domain ATP-binding protein